VRALGHREIQGVLDACFFEPGPWQPPGSVAVPADVPAPSRAHMATPAGLLLHELSNAPAPLAGLALTPVPGVRLVTTGAIAPSRRHKLH
jgi:hypothetical protein